jgi:hypothetical protein
VLTFEKEDDDERESPDFGDCSGRDAGHDDRVGFIRLAESAVPRRICASGAIFHPDPSGVVRCPPIHFSQG